MIDVVMYESVGWRGRPQAPTLETIDGRGKVLGRSPRDPALVRRRDAVMSQLRALEQRIGELGAGRPVLSPLQKRAAAVVGRLRWWKDQVNLATTPVLMIPAAERYLGKVAPMIAALPTDRSWSLFAGLGDVAAIAG